MNYYYIIILFIIIINIYLLYEVNVTKSKELFNQYVPKPDFNEKNITDNKCYCPNNDFLKIYDNNSYWCDLPLQLSKWGKCMPNKEDPRTGKKRRGSGIKILPQGNGKICNNDATINGQQIKEEEETCIPTNLDLVYWIKAFTDNGCDSYWFSEVVHFPYIYNNKTYNNGIEFYNDMKNEGWGNNEIFQWALERYNEGNGICNPSWRGPEGQCRSQWEKSNIKDRYYLCKTDSGECKLETLNTKQTEMDPNIIDFVYNIDELDQCNKECPIKISALNHEYTKYMDDNIYWKHGKCDNVWEGGKRNIYWLCDAEKGLGIGHINPILLTIPKYTDNINISNNIYNDYESAYIECMPERPEYEGPMIDRINHISYIAKNELNKIDNIYTRYPTEWSNEYRIEELHKIHGGDIDYSLNHGGHPELYGAQRQEPSIFSGDYWNPPERSDNVTWYEEMLRDRMHDTNNVIRHTYNACDVNIHEKIPHTDKSSINFFSQPTKHKQDYIDQGIPLKCKHVNKDYNNLEDIIKLRPQIRDVNGVVEADNTDQYYYLTESKKTYKLEKGVNTITDIHQSPWKQIYDNLNNATSLPDIIGNTAYLPIGPDGRKLEIKVARVRKLDYDWTLKEVVDYDINKPCYNADELSTLYFNNKWDDTINLNNDAINELSFIGYAKYNKELDPSFGDFYSSLYTCGLACREHDECKFFTYFPHPTLSYFKGYGPASVHPINPYPLTYHGSSYGGLPQEACENYFNPFHRFNDKDVVNNPKYKDYAGFYANDKKHLSYRNKSNRSFNNSIPDGRRMGCTWVTGSHIKQQHIDNDAHFYPYHLISKYYKDSDNHPNCDAYICKGDITIPKNYIPINEYNLSESIEPITFPYWFLNNHNRDDNLFISESNYKQQLFYKDNVSENFNNIKDVIGDDVFSNFDYYDNQGNIDNNKLREHKFLFLYEMDYINNFPPNISIIRYNLEKILENVTFDNYWRYNRTIDFLTNKYNNDNKLNNNKPFFKNILNNINEKTTNNNNIISIINNNVSDEIKKLNNNSNEIKSNFNNEKLEYLKLNPDRGNFKDIPDFLKQKEVDYLNIIAINDKKIKDLSNDKNDIIQIIDDVSNARIQLPIYIQKTYDFNYQLFNSIPVHKNSPFQRYIWNKNFNSWIRNNNGSNLKYLVPPYVNIDTEKTSNIQNNNIDSKNSDNYIDYMTEKNKNNLKNVAVYKYYPTSNEKSINDLGVSCNDMMTSNDKLSKGENPDSNIPTKDNTINWKYDPNNFSGDVVKIERRKDILRTHSRDPKGQCKLYNYNIKNPKLIDSQKAGIPWGFSGVLTDRNSFSLPQNSNIDNKIIRRKKFLSSESSSEFLKNNKSDQKQINNTYMITSYS